MELGQLSLVIGASSAFPDNDPLAHSHHCILGNNSIHSVWFIKWNKDGASLGLLISIAFSRIFCVSNDVIRTCNSSSYAHVSAAHISKKDKSKIC